MEGTGSEMNPTTTVATTTPGFTQAGIEELSRSRREPGWVLEGRRAAWRAFEQMPMPTLQDEEWRRTDLRGLKLERFQPVTNGAGVARALADLPAGARAGLEEIQGVGGLLVDVDGQVTFADLDPALAAQGVRFLPLAQAVRDEPELVQRWLGRAVPATYNKFSALSHAFWASGAVLYVPASVQVELPLRVRYWKGQAGLATFPHTLVVLERNASATYIEEHLSACEGPSYVGNVVELVLEPGAELRYVHLQELDREAWTIGAQRAVINRDARLSSLVGGLGARFSKQNVESIMETPGGWTEMLGLFFGDGEQFLDYHTLQDHVAPHCTSDLLYKGVLKDRARSVFSGLIRVHKNAQRTDAYQANRNLLLSNRARADSIPNLEIEANDVHCTHGSTVSQVDPEQLFYLMARGLPRSAAERLIVDGFFEPIMERIPLDDVRERLRLAIRRKMGV